METNLMYDQFTATSQFRVSGGLNQDVKDIVNVLPGGPSVFDKYYYSPTSKFATYYGAWKFSDPYPGQIINIPSGINQGIKIINQLNTPVALTYAATITQNVAYVAKNGNDISAILNDPTFPFLTIDAAYNAAFVTGVEYLIYVWPGVYNVSQNICGGKIAYYFSGGTTVNYSTIPFANAIGNDVSGFRCYGYASFAGGKLINFSTAGGAPATSDIYIECDNVTCTTDAITIDNTSNISINIRESFTSSGQFLICGDSTGTLIAGDISCTNGMTTSGTGTLTLMANSLISGGFLFNVSAIYVVNVNVSKLENTVNVPAITVSGTLFAKGNILDCVGTLTVTGNCYIEYGSLDISGASSSGVLSIAAMQGTVGATTVSLGNTYLNINNFAIDSFSLLGGTCSMQLGVGTSNQHTVNGGNLLINAVSLTSVQTVISFNDGSVDLYGRYICPTAVSATSANGNIRLYGVFICSGLDSIISTVNRFVTSYDAHSNVRVDATIRTRGSFDVNAAYT